jgi:uncharacterized membrane protein
VREAAVDSRLRVHGHPIQPMLVTFPFGLFVCATVFDLAALVGGPAFLGQVGYWTAIAGLLAAALTTVAGLVDLWDAPGDRTRRTALGFNLANAVCAGMFVVVCLIRSGAPERGVTGGALAAELLAMAVGALGVRLGTVLVRRYDPGPPDRGGLDALRRPRRVPVDGYARHTPTA